MGKDRFLFCMYTMTLHVIGIDDAINQFARLHPRRLELESVLLA